MISLNSLLFSLYSSSSSSTTSSIHLSIYASIHPHRCSSVSRRIHVMRCDVFHSIFIAFIWIPNTWNDNRINRINTADCASLFVVLLLFAFDSFKNIRAKNCSGFHGGQTNDLWISAIYTISRNFISINFDEKSEIMAHDTSHRIEWNENLK